MSQLRRLIFSLVCFALPLSAQQGRISADTDVRSAPGGTVVAQLRAGTTWTTGATRAGFTSVTLTAWVDGSRFGAARDSFPVTIRGTVNLRIRETPSLQGRILGNFRGGAGVRVLEERDGWARIRREVWVPSSAIAVVAAQRPSNGSTTTPNTRPTGQAANTPAPVSRPGGQAPVAATPVQSESTPIAAPAPAGALRTERTAVLSHGPNGNRLGELAPGTIVIPQVRERGWVKVRVEAWVPESLFVPADTAYGATLTAADLRANPEGHRGRIVRWEVQIVGMQTADPLRRDMTPNEPFLLAMGPTGENATLYVTVPQALVSEARAIAPLTTVLLTARIRTGRSSPTGAPILELISLVKR
jgi:uncharacterized protein YgiM (DUF1202 family)